MTRAQLTFLLALVAAGAAWGQAIEPSLKEKLLAIPLSPELGGTTTRPVATKDAFTFVAGNASEEHKAAFKRGNLVFGIEWVAGRGFDPRISGLGPLFNRNSCSNCHLNNGRGAPPAEPRHRLETSLVRISIPGTDPNGGPNPVPGYGDQVRDRSVDGVPPEAKPSISWIETRGTYADGTAYTLRRSKVDLKMPGYGAFPADVMTSLRVTNPLIGGGLLDAVPDSTLAALQDPDDKDGDGISGRVNIVFDMLTRTKRIGRFGWKASIARLRHQDGAAALNDMGISNPLLPLDLCRKGQDACVAAALKATPASGIEMNQDQFDDLVIYTQLLAVPHQRSPESKDVQRGERVFRDIGCAACHMPTLITAPDAELPELRNQTIHPFTDLLLHDMGEGLADHRPDYLASGTEWRTTPLWGVGLTQKVSGHTFLLHDGRARNLAEAILWHGGEAKAAQEKFRALPKATREDLLSFLESL